MGERRKRQQVLTSNFAFYENANSVCKHIASVKYNLIKQSLYFCLLAIIAVPEYIIGIDFQKFYLQFVGNSKFYVIICNHGLLKNCEQSN